MLPQTDKIPELIDPQALYTSKTSGKNRVTPREVAPARFHRGLLRCGLREILRIIRVLGIVYTHNTQPPCNSGNLNA